MDKPKYTIHSADLYDAIARIRNISVSADSDMAKILRENPTARVKRSDSGYEVTWYSDHERSFGLVGLRIARFDKDGKQIGGIIATKSAAQTSTKSYE